MLGKVFFYIKKECLHQFFATSVTLHDSTSEIATLKMESEYAVFFVKKGSSGGSSIKERSGCD